MVRFKVIKGSHLLLYFSIAVLVLVVAAIVLSTALSGKSETVHTQANLVQARLNLNIEAETDPVFASTSVSNDALQLDPGTEDSLSVEILPAPSATQAADMPSVLIYHTHTHEAYEQMSSDPYEAIEAWRTTDPDHSIVRVGEELAALLRERGFEVVHDTTDHEQDDLMTAYTRSLETLEGYEQRFDLYIDLHRDAYLEGVSEMNLMHDGQALAQLMLLIGNGEGFTVKPHYEENLYFAKQLTRRINQNIPDLCKDVLVKDGRYNQHIGVFSILIEVGHNRNTLQEALASLPCLADSLESLMISNPDPQLTQMQLNYSSTAE